eukprot:TRINITY_DN29325_c0_g1_i1.p1 TRINITY_DN29325_c0_g1~~TRINITY_DN29325_c0_g1_i1.p1  ORF type:complete len:536 (+),score=76.20 TRINITY_DN29325_c0_g1_i1:117-1724(+)
MSHSYWVRAEIFEHYVMPVGMPQDYALAGLLKIPGEAGSSSQHLSYGDWITAARMHLQLSDTMASALFESFVGLCYNTPQEQLEATREELHVRESGRYTQWLSDRKVPQPPFLLFLYCQLFNRTGSLTGALAQPEPAFYSGGLGSPGGRAGSPTHGRSPARDAALRARATEHEQATTFVQQNLYQLLALLAPNKYKLHFYQLEDLRYILCEGDAQHREVPFGTHMPWWRTDKYTPVDASHVQNFIVQGLGVATKIYPPSELPSARSHQKILWPGMPEAAISKVAIVRGLQKTMFSRISQTFPGQVVTVQISCCHQANIYILAPLKNVSIVGCTNTNVVLGAVQGVVTVEHCEKVRIVCAARQLRICKTQDSRIYTCVNTAVQSFSGNRHVEVAPYNGVYPALEDHLVAAGVNPSFNLWNDVSFLCREAAPNDSIVGPLRPELFSSLSIPLTTSGRTSRNPCSMPREYIAELKRKSTAASKACSVLRDVAAAQQDDDARVELSKAVNDRFRHWLQSSGNLRHVLELLHHRDSDDEM